MKKCTPSPVLFQMKITKIYGQNSNTLPSISSLGQDTPNSWPDNELIQQRPHLTSISKLLKTNNSSKTNINYLRTRPSSPSKNLLNNNSDRIHIIKTPPIILTTTGWRKAAPLDFAAQTINPHNQTVKMPVNGKLSV